MKKIDLGCGGKKKEGFLGLDIIPSDNVDYVLDLSQDNLPFENDSVSEVYSSHFFEHIAEPKHLLHEVVRVASPGGKFEVWTPYLKSNDAFVIHHICFYNETIWNHICKYFPEFWFESAQGVLRLDRIHFVLMPDIESDLAKLRIPLDFALQHMFNIVCEMGAFMTVLKGPDAIRLAKSHTPEIMVSYSRDNHDRRVREKTESKFVNLGRRILRKFRPGL